MKYVALSIGALVILEVTWRFARRFDIWPEWWSQ